MIKTEQPIKISSLLAHNKPDIYIKLIQVPVYLSTILTFVVGQTVFKRHTTIYRTLRDNSF